MPGRRRRADDARDRGTDGCVQLDHGRRRGRDAGPSSRSGFSGLMGIAGGLVGPLAGLIALTVPPALFVLLGERVNALSPRRWRRAAERAALGAQGGWYRLAHGLMRRPLPVAAAATALLVPRPRPAVPSRSASPVSTPRCCRRAPARAQSTPRSGVTSRPRSSHRPYAVLDGSAGAARAYAAAVGTAARRGARPRAAAAPRPAVWEVRASSGAPFLAAAFATARARQLRALPGSAPSSAARPRSTSTSGTRSASRLPLAIGLLCGVMVLLLFAATRSLVLPLKALIMNGLTLAAALGILVFVFQNGRLEGLLDYRSQGALQLTQPVLLFAISFGLADRLRRVPADQDQGGLGFRAAEPRGGRRRPSSAPARIVTAAALLFCIAVGAFATSNVILVKEVGLGIALAVSDRRLDRPRPPRPVADGDPRPLELVARTTASRRRSVSLSRLRDQLVGAEPVGVVVHHSSSASARRPPSAPAGRAGPSAPSPGEPTICEAVQLIDELALVGRVLVGRPLPPATAASTAGRCAAAGRRAPTGCVQPAGLLVGLGADDGDADHRVRLRERRRGL